MDYSRRPATSTQNVYWPGAEKMKVSKTSAPVRLHANLLLWPLQPEWWNWQTQETQNLPISRSWGFDSLLGHQLSRTVPLMLPCCAVRLRIALACRGLPAGGGPSARHC